MNSTTGFDYIEILDDHFLMVGMLPSLLSLIIAQFFFCVFH